MNKELIKILQGEDFDGDKLQKMLDDEQIKPDDLVDYIRKINSEAAKRRHALLPALNVLGERTVDGVTADAMAKLMSQFLELKNQKGDAADHPEIKTLQSKIESMNASLKGLLEQQVSVLPEPVRDLVPEYDDPVKRLEWISRAAGKLGGQPPATADQKKEDDKQADKKPVDDALKKKSPAPKDNSAGGTWDEWYSKMPEGWRHFQARSGMSERGYVANFFVGQGEKLPESLLTEVEKELVPSQLKESVSNAVSTGKP